MNRYMHYRQCCDLERRQPMDAVQFRVEFEGRFGARHRTVIDWPGELTHVEAAFIQSVVNESPRRPSKVGRLVGMIGTTIQTARSVVGSRRNVPLDDRPEFGGTPSTVGRLVDIIGTTIQMLSARNKAATAGTVFGSSRNIPLDDRPEFGGRVFRNDPPSDTAPGVREPLRPLAPLLSGSAARAYPPTEPPRWYAS